ncbi:SET domain-containing protein [Artomyces pyxidatus]|uniref:SET domain-containing protein n=1 Tax=Artomyces pyxidatus TaxID=48021 RepID=A0ACB8SW82_9AGAM|nr:SET domain-containing protein [Artomyces pyxidatus]
MPLQVERSPSPEEDYGDAEWPVVGIVGEEIDIRWENWRREDGSDTTWATSENATDDIQELIEDWKKSITEQRHSLAVESTTISLLPLSGSALHDNLTAEASEAHREKQSKTRAGPNRFSDWDGDIQRVLDAHSDPRGDELDGEARPVRSLPRRPRSLQHILGSPITSRTGLTRAVPQPRPSPPKIALQEKWNRAIRNAKAAPLAIVSASDEDIPVLPDDFEYREQGYTYIVGSPPDMLFPDDDMFLRCECTGRCKSALRCHCQQISTLEDDSGRRTFAYTSMGLVHDTLIRGVHTHGVHIIECNQNCSCDMTCPNRAAQKPRDVPLELFHTRNRGWGIRTATQVPAGKVLGCYVGLTSYSHRSEATRPGIAHNYMFDLDGHEHGDHDDEDEQMNSYTVDAYHEGNWTRFVNHSCSPNMRVYNVVYDTIPETNAPHLAFVTLNEIPAQTELTIDYDPRGAEEGGEEKEGAEEGKRRPGMTRCMCGHAKCRGWVHME